MEHNIRVCQHCFIRIIDKRKNIYVCMRSCIYVYIYILLMRLYNILALTTQLNMCICMYVCMLYENSSNVNDVTKRTRVTMISTKKRARGKKTKGFMRLRERGNNDMSNRRTYK